MSKPEVPAYIDMLYLRFYNAGFGDIAHDWIIKYLYRFENAADDPVDVMELYLEAKLVWNTERDEFLDVSKTLRYLGLRDEPAQILSIRIGRPYLRASQILNCTRHWIRCCQQQPP